MSDDSLTARNRINQRNFRARRQNYIKELEERIRKYELESVQATIEVQAAARQVTDHNNKLRNLLMQKYGMSEYDINDYLGFPQSNSAHSQPFANVFVTNTQLASLAPAPVSAPSGGLAPKPSISMEATHSYPTPPQQHDPPRAFPSNLLDPALSLASLREFSSASHESVFSDLTSSRHNSNHSITNSMSLKSSWEQQSHRPDSPTDTLSESSNPATPAEQQQTLHTDAHRPSQAQTNAYLNLTTSQPQAVSPCCTVPPSQQDLNINRPPRPNDETACEEAARIIASMRGGGSDDSTPDQVMLELGCGSSDAKCRVKNLSIFQLMDRG